MQILDIIGNSGGFVTDYHTTSYLLGCGIHADGHHRCIIVDSTRRGKSMPDALSKTIPIWCAVINRLLFEDMYESHKLSTPKDVVGSSEHTKIEELLHGFVDNVKVNKTSNS